MRGEARPPVRVISGAGRRKSGEVFPIDLAVTEIAGDGELRYAAFIRDGSERVRLHEQLIRRERLAAVGMTAARLAHEVGNPLNAMSMSVQLLERRICRQGQADCEAVCSTLRNPMGEIPPLDQLLGGFRFL